MSNTSSTGMLPSEKRAAWSLSLIYLTRMLGLFVILPVFSLLAIEYEHSTPFLIGLAIGIYGLFQALLQIPFGRLSDKFGRKPVIAAGLILMIIGSAVAALSESIYWVIFGRALQGSGAIAAVLMALAADLSRDDQRTKMMAMLGASIGFSFLLALMVGPVLIKWLSIAWLFWFTGGMAILGLLVLYFLVPEPEKGGFSADTSAKASTVFELLRHPQLLRLDFSIFYLHVLVTATFVAVPTLLVKSGLAADQHWQLYLGSFVVAIVMLIPLIMLAEREMMRGVLIICIVGLMVSLLLFSQFSTQVTMLVVGMALFFGFFSTMEALLPSLVSRIAPAASRGSATGIYASSQFMGAFVGGAGGGWLLGVADAQRLFFVLAVACLLWIFVLLGFKRPAKLSRLRKVLSTRQMASGEAAIAFELSNLPGVEEVAVALDEGVAYLKIDKSQFSNTPAA
ncbi:MAG: MFS transporter [Granulosicoccaceae bacterium]